MSAIEIQSKARELKELKVMKEELEAEIAAAEDAIKAVMGDEVHRTGRRRNRREEGSSLPTLLQRVPH